MLIFKPIKRNFALNEHSANGATDIACWKGDRTNK